MILTSLDESLVAAAQAGSTEAFARLVDRHQQALRAFLRRACGDWALADDLAQETFLTAWARIGRLKEGASVRAWLCGIGYNKHLTSRRSAARDRAREALYETEAIGRSTLGGKRLIAGPRTKTNPWTAQPQLSFPVG